MGGGLGPPAASTNGYPPAAGGGGTPSEHTDPESMAEQADTAWVNSYVYGDFRFRAWASDIGLGLGFVSGLDAGPGVEFVLHKSGRYSSWLRRLFCVLHVWCGLVEPWSRSNRPGRWLWYVTHMVFGVFYDASEHRSFASSLARFECTR